MMLVSDHTASCRCLDRAYTQTNLEIFLASGASGTITIYNFLLPLSPEFLLVLDVKMYFITNVHQVMVMVHVVGRLKLIKHLNLQI